MLFIIDPSSDQRLKLIERDTVAANFARKERQMLSTTFSEQKKDRQHP